MTSETLPAWWPACPYPADIFPMALERYAELVPDPEQRTALSGALGRHFWQIASAEIWRSYQLEQNGADGRLPEPDWRQAPDWARWWAMDRDGRSWWFAQRPGIRPGAEVWVDNGGYVGQCHDVWRRAERRPAEQWHPILAAQWQDSLRQRPAANDK